MNDGQRVYPVNYLVLHHSAGPDMIGLSDLEIQDWFSNSGKSRAYENGNIDPMHEHPGRPGVKTYSQAQFAGVIDSTNKYNYRIVELIARPFQNVAWHAGNWDINTKSVGIECCGNYLDKQLEDRQLMCIADWYRVVDQELNGNSIILGHKEIYATACPGRIMEQRDKLVDMINNPDKWNKILFPVTFPIYKEPVTTTPQIETKPEIVPEVKNDSQSTSEPKEQTCPTLPEKQKTMWDKFVELIVELLKRIMNKE